MGSTLGGLFNFGNNVKNYVVAVKHPSEMVRRLIFQPGTKRIYASFPISATRSSSNDRGLVDAFRFRLHSEFTVFDPLTIDERIIRSEYDSQSEEGDYVTIDISNRWPIGFSGELEPMAPSFDSNYPLSIPANQIKEAFDDIDRQIEARDYRLIGQVQAVAAFRPNFRGHSSRGVSSELLYSSQSIGLPVHLLWDEAEDGQQGTSPFSAFGTLHENIESLIKAL